MNTIKLYDFQKELGEKLGDPDIKGRLIGDDMGLGKTYECLEIERRLRETHVAAKRMRTLIVAPQSVHEVWQRALVEFLDIDPQDIVVIDRKHRERFAAEVRKGTRLYYICHYEALRLKGMETLGRVQWFHVIGDEIHRVKNPRAQQTQLFKRLRTQFKTGASGSLADDKPQDFWSPLNWVRPDLFPKGTIKNPQKLFIKDWCETEEFEGRLIGFDDEGEEIRQIHERVIGIRRDRLREFHALIGPFYERRLKSDVGLDLPEKYYTTINVHLYPSQQKVYNGLRDEFLAWIGEHEDQPLKVHRMYVMAQLMRLQQAALATLEWTDTGKVDQTTGKPIRKVHLIEPSAKLDTFVDWARDVTDQVVVFSQSKSMIELTAVRLQREGARVGVYTGSTPDKDRQPMIDAFQAGQLDFFLGTIKAGGESITLHRSSTVAFFDKTWSPFRNKQAEDRVHRIGQKNAVQVVNFYMPNSVDTKVRRRNMDKWSVLRSLLGDDRD